MWTVKNASLAKLSRPRKKSPQFSQLFPLDPAWMLGHDRARARERERKREREREIREREREIRERERERCSSKHVSTSHEFGMYLHFHVQLVLLGLQLILQQRDFHHCGCSVSMRPILAIFKIL